MACSLDGTKPLPEPKLISPCITNEKEHIRIQVEKKKKKN